MKEEKRTEDKQTFGELMVASEEVRHHPIFREIINAAPSPTAADKYVVALGWGNNVARRVRDAVRLREMCYEKKLDWDTVNEIPENFMMKSGDAGIKAFAWGYSGDRASKIALEDDIHLTNSTKYDRTKWPLFFREFSLGSVEKYGYLSSLGTHGKFVPANLSSMDSPMDFTTREGWDHEYGFGFFRLNHLSVTDLSSKSIASDIMLGASVHFFQERLHAEVLFCAVPDKNEDIRICGKTVRHVNESRHPFPEFYKVLELNQRYHENTTDCIRIIIKKDIVPNQAKNPCGKTHFLHYYNDDNPKFVGKLILERIVKISDTVNVKLMLRYWITHTAEDGFDKAELVLDKKHSPIVVDFTTGDTNETGIDGFETAVSKATCELSLLLTKIHKKGSVNLEEVAGLSMLENPPKQLVDLFLE